MAIDDGVHDVDVKPSTTTVNVKVRTQITKPPTKIPSARRTRITCTGRTNLSRQGCRPLSQSTSMPALPSQSAEGGHLLKKPSNHFSDHRALASRDSRRRETATWSGHLAPDCCEWTTEARDATRGAETAVELEKKWLEQDRQRTMQATQALNRLLFCKARERLCQLASHKFGSLKAMFKELKVSESGTITLDEFSTGLKRLKLENVFPREYQRIVFSAMDEQYKEQLHVNDLQNILNPDMDNYSQERIIAFPLPDDGDLTNDQRSLVNPASLIDKPLLPEELHPVKDKIIDAVFRKTRLEKREEAVPDHKEYLMNAFKQLDANMSGTLAPDQLLMALGPGHLDLDVDTAEMRPLVDFMSLKSQGRISYKEFVRYLEFTDIEPDYNPFFDHRNRDLLSLKRLSEAPWQWKHGPGRKEDLLVPNHDIPEPTRDAAAHEGDAVNQPHIRPLLTSQQIKDYNKSLVMSAAEKAHESSRPRTSTGDVFADLRATNQRKLQSICPRFVPPPPTDWTRTGCGGNGVNCKSGLYLDPCEQYVTTSSVYFKPLCYRTDGSVTRDAVSDAQKIVDQRRRRAKARMARNIALHKDMAEQQRKCEEMRFMNEEQKLKQKARLCIVVPRSFSSAQATEMYDYYRRTFEKDFGTVRRSMPEVMQKRSNANLFTRMWGGSPNNMLHPANRPKHVREVWRTTLEVSEESRTVAHRRLPDRICSQWPASSFEVTPFEFISGISRRCFPYSLASRTGSSREGAARLRRHTKPADVLSSVPSSALFTRSAWGVEDGDQRQHFGAERRDVGAS